MSSTRLGFEPEAVLNALPQAVIATDPDGRITYWSRAAERLYGWAADEALETSLVDLLAPEPLVAEALSILERVRGGQEWSGELLRRHSDGSTVQVRVVQQPLRDNHG
ncbi:MAG: PAS domain-containing protein, partial [Acidimicrobiales bacterium]